MEDIKEYYNRVPREKYKGEYEHNRWFKNALDRDRYAMMRSGIETHIADIHFKTCFELGPGPGTWTKVLVTHEPNAKYTLLDISEEMRRQFNAQMSNAEYRVGDFESLESSERYDFFFSSRAFEYLKDKREAVRKIFGLLHPGGAGMIITKTPHYTKMKFLGQSVPWQHRSQISPRALGALLKDVGFRDIRLYPAVVYAPLVGRVRAFNTILASILRDTRLNQVTQLITEAYMVTFIKPFDITQGKS